MERHPRLNRVWLSLLACTVRRRKVIFVAVALLLAASVAGIFSGRFSSDISKMLSDGSESAKTYEVMNLSGLTNRVVISLRFKAGAFSDLRMGQYLTETARELSKSVLVRRVQVRSGAAEFAGLPALTPYLPQLCGEPEIGKLRGMLDPEAGERAVRGCFRRLVSLTGIGQADMIRSDPFGLKSGLLSKLELLGELSGISLALDEEYLVNGSRSAAMMVLHTTVSAADTVRSRELLELVEGVLGKRPSSVEYDIIAAHRRSLHNEKMVRSDLQLVAVISFVSFLLLFFLLYRSDFRSLLILAVPLVAGTLAVALMTVLFDQTLLIITSMGGVVVGLGVDYGIHVYASMSRDGRIWRVSRIVVPLAASALTSVAVFALFLCSSVDGYRQLGFFVGVSLLLCFVLALVLLPSLLRGNRRPSLLSGTMMLGLARAVSRRGAVVAGIWGLTAVAALLLLTRLDVNADVMQLDGGSREIDLAEARFQAEWRTGPGMAFVGVKAESLDAAQSDAEKIGARIRDAIPGVRMFSPTDLWPSARASGANLAMWRRFRDSGGLSKLEEEVRRQGEKTGLDGDFFDPFFSGVRTGMETPPALPAGFVEPFLENLMRDDEGGHAVLICLPDDERVLGPARAVVRGDPGSAVISGSSFRRMISDEILGVVAKLGLITLALLVAISLCFTRRLSLMLITLVPVFSAIVFTGGVLAVAGVPLNVSVFIAGIILTGLSFDYGIFMVHSLSRGEARHVLRAVSLSAATSVAGAASVIFARHPILHYAGLTLAIGIAMAWITSIFVVPALFGMVQKGGRGTVRTWGGLAVLVLLLSGCRSAPFERPQFGPLPSKAPAELIADFEASQPEKLLVESGIVFHWKGRTFSALCTARLDSVTNDIRVVGMTMLGVKLFEASGRPGAAVLEYMDAQLELGEAGFAEGIIGDMARVHFDNVPKGSWKSEVADGQLEIVEETEGSGAIEYVYAGDPTVLVSKRAFRNGDLLWEVNYWKYDLSEGLLSPVSVTYENVERGYDLVIRTREIRAVE